MQVLILVIHVMVAIAIIALVLVQHGKGADVGAAFGSGASNTMFGSSGTTSFLLKVTIAFAIVFFATSLSLSFFAAHASKHAKADILNLSSAPSAPVTTNKVKNQVPADLPKVFGADKTRSDDKAKEGKQ